MFRVVCPLDFFSELGDFWDLGIHIQIYGISLGILVLFMGLLDSFLDFGIFFSGREDFDFLCDFIDFLWDFGTFLSKIYRVYRVVSDHITANGFFSFLIYNQIKDIS